MSSASILFMLFIFIAEAAKNLVHIKKWGRMEYFAKTISIMWTSDELYCKNEYNYLS